VVSDRREHATVSGPQPAAATPDRQAGIARRAVLKKGILIRYTQMIFWTRGDSVGATRKTLRQFLCPCRATAGLLVFLLFLLPGALAQGEARNVGKGAGPAPGFDTKETAEKMVRYLRERFGIREDVKLSFGEFRSSSQPEFYASTLTVDDGKEKKTQDFFVSKDGRYMVQGNIIAPSAPASSVPNNLHDSIARTVREHFKIPETTKVEVGPLREAALKNFSVATISVGEGAQKQTQDFLVSQDGRRLIQGSLYGLGTDPRRENVKIISLEDQPSQGPANAPVTIVEYADLECPMCARVHEFLEKELLPKYKDKVRLVFKEFPLVSIHDWSTTAALATQCAYAMDPQTFLPLRAMIFENQAGLKVTNIRDMLLTYGERVGLDRRKLADCIDSKESLPRVEQGATEGQRLGIVSTPTCFINGKPILGLSSPEDFYKVVDAALREAK
jgi:protein-disulfide isomerase